MRRVKLLRTRRVYLHGQIFSTLKAAFHKDHTQSTPESRSAAKSYLEAWVGTPPPARTSQPPSTFASVHAALRRHTSSSLSLSSASYLLPTLRLERNDTPESLCTRLQQASAITTTTNNNNDSHSSWYCPIVLDVSAHAPDGSPHYRPPPAHFLLDIRDTLSKYGHLEVVGITSSSTTSTQAMMEEAATLGIPSLPRAAQPRRPKSNDQQQQQQQWNVEHVIQLVQRRRQQEQEQQQIEIQNEDDTQTQAAHEGIIKATKPLKGNGESTPILSTTATTSASTDQTSTDLIPPQPSVPPQVVEQIPLTSSSTLYHGSVRSGQQVCSAKGHSLVIFGSVNSGGEVFSDGDIFIFGTLRGRALAGLGEQQQQQGPSSCTIVANKFDPELVGIGQTVATIDSVEEFVGKPIPPGQPILVQLNSQTGDLEASPVVR